jgi:hypothetical protein
MKFHVYVAGAAASLALAFAAVPANAAPLSAGVSDILPTAGLVQSIRYDGYEGYHEQRRWWRWRHRHDEGWNWGWRRHHWDRFNGRRDSWDDRRGDRGWHRD